MPFQFPQSQSLKGLPSDGRLLFTTRMVRLFAYGFLSIILVIYLAALGLSQWQIGALLTLTLLGDALISLWMTAIADQAGRRRMLKLGAGLMIFAGILFSLTSHFWILVVAAAIGVISPHGSEVGPFLAVEQATLAQVVEDKKRTRVFAWYNFAGSLATALGSLSAGALTQILNSAGFDLVLSCRMIVAGYALLGVVLWRLFSRLTPAAEVIRPKEKLNVRNLFQTRFGLKKSQKFVVKLSMLFALDAFAGGFVIQSISAYWFHIRFGVEPAVLGQIFFGANILAGFSGFWAARLAAKIGLINTMVFTHIPSNILLILVPLMPNLSLAIAILLLRFSISQMDVPTRQSYTLAVVTPEERSAAGGITNISRTLGMSLSPLFVGPLLASASLLNFSFFIAGGLKIVYDLMVYRGFRSLRPPEER